MAHNKSDSTIHPVLYFIIFTLVLAIFGAYLLGRNSVEDMSGFSISAVADENAGYISFTGEDLGGNYENGIQYYGLSAVHIEIGGDTYPLNEAVRDELVTVEEIIAQAKIDSRDRSVCRLRYSTNHGVTTFVYQYNTYDLVVRYDVLDAPDGKQYLFEDVIFAAYDTGRQISLGYSYVDENNVLVNPLQEDWGLTFSIAEVTPERIYLEYTQEGGQHVGQLVIGSVYVERVTGDSAELLPYPGSDPFAEITLEQDASSGFAVDWSGSCGALPSGEYVLHLMVRDIYSESEVHAFQDNYQDSQTHTIFFSIP